MRKKLLSLILTAVMATVLFACANTEPTGDTGSQPSQEESKPADSTPAESTPADTGETPVAESGPTRGGQLIYGSATELSGDWGRAMWTNNATDQLVRNLMDDYSTVVSNQGGEYVLNPTVVKNYDTKENDDGTKTYIITINQGLVYNNGDPITAKDFVVGALFSTSQVAKDLEAVVAGDLQIVGGADYKSGETSYCSGIRLLDDWTFSISILADYLPYYYDITYASAYPMHLAYWFGDGIDVKDDGEGCYFTDNFTADNVRANVEAARFATGNRITAGPYNLVEFDKSSLQATLTINDKYAGNFEGQKPNVEKLIIITAEEETWADALKTGQFEFYDTVTDGAQINEALDIVDAGGFDYVQFSRAGYGRIAFQCDFGPTQFESVRHAIAYLLDRNDFADAFCQGWGGVVNGPYGLGLWQYVESEEWLADNLNSYAYSFDKAVAELTADGWTLDATGAAWSSGTRYKEVTAEEAGDYAHNVVLADGRILMPLIIEWSSSGNAVAELLSVKLVQNPDLTAAGMVINENVMTFSELLNFLYRDSSQGEKYGVKTYGMFNLATGFQPAYDQSYTWTLDPDLVAEGWNTNFLLDEQMDKLSMDMVYGIDPTDKAGYLDVWQKYILRFNELLPDVPLYSNVYISVFPDKLKGYTQDTYWDFPSAIVYAWIEE